jgi:hypothetical protein
MEYWLTASAPFGQWTTESKGNYINILISFAFPVN